jgi:hypothetical protein
MGKCKGSNAATNYYNGRKPCTRIIINDKYKNGYCHLHQDQATRIEIPTPAAAPTPTLALALALAPTPKVIHQMPDSDSEDEYDHDGYTAQDRYEQSIDALGDEDDNEFTQTEQEKVLTELSLWMPNEKERVLAATQLVLDKCKQLTKEKEAMTQCIEQTIKEKTLMGKCIDQQFTEMQRIKKLASQYKGVINDNIDEIERLTDEADRHQMTKNDISQLMKENAKLMKENELLKLKQQGPIIDMALQKELTRIKEQRDDAKKQINLMLSDYQAYQEIRNFEEISTRLMATYMADSHYDLYGKMRKNPEEAIPYLGKSPEIEYNALRQKRNKHCHPVPNPY